MREDFLSVVERGFSHPTGGADVDITEVLLDVGAIIFTRRLQQIRRTVLNEVGSTLQRHVRGVVLGLFQVLYVGEKSVIISAGAAGRKGKQIVSHLMKHEKEKRKV